jgi:rRNA-processing protein FCF1
MEIIIDTNFIITLLKENINLETSLNSLFGDYILLVPELVLQELKFISQDKKSKMIDRQSAKIAIQLLEKSHIIKSEKKLADSAIIQYVKNKDNLILASLDKKLKSQIKAQNPKIKFLTIRGKKKIELQ